MGNEIKAKRLRSAIATQSQVVSISERRLDALWHLNAGYQAFMAAWSRLEEDRRILNQLKAQLVLLEH